MDKRAFFFVLALSAGLFFINQWFAPQPLPPSAAVEAPSLPEEVIVESKEPTPQQQEDLYVLENGVQQIVFSTLGGAVKEINLPFQSTAHENSLVLPIGFDTTMEKDYPYNDHFPSGSYYKNGSRQKVQEGQIGGYYPLLRRDVLGKSGEPIYPLSPRCFAFSVVSDLEALEGQSYQVSRFEKNMIEFTRTDALRKITKTYTLLDAPYCLELSITVEGDTRGLWLTTGVPEVELVSGSFTPSLKYLLQRTQKAQVESLSLPKELMTYSSLSPSWVSNSNGFLGLIVEPLTDVGSGFKTNFLTGKMAPTKLSLIDAEHNLYPLDKYPGYEFLLPLRSVSPTAPLKLRVFAGPYQDSLLKQLDTTFSQTGKNPNLSSALSFQGWFTFISEPFAKFLFLLMKLFYQITHSWGFSIILLTLALRIMLYPLNGWSIKSSLKMQEIAPMVTAIQERYKKDPKRAQMEVVNLYREKRVNPLSGCLPVLIQIPFLIGMFDLLKSVFELRGVSFIPGWINNLTAPDVVFSWSYPIFFFGTSLHLLPLLLGAVMYLQQRLTSKIPKDPKMLTDAQKQQKLMGNVMVVVFTVMFYHFPSGLNLYWLSSTLLGILQQWMATRQIKTHK